MQRLPCLLLTVVGLVMALIKLYEQRERARFMTTYQVMLPMDRHQWPDANAARVPLPLTFETRFTAVSHGAGVNVHMFLRVPRGQSCGTAILKG